MLPKNLDENQLELICAIIGSCDFFKINSGNLEMSILQVIDPEFSDSVHILAESERFTDLSGEAMDIAAQCLVWNEVESGFASMVSLDWFNLDPEIVAGVSPVMSRMFAYLSRCLRNISNTLEESEYMKICETFISSLFHLIDATLIKMRPIGEGGAQQLLVDFSFLKTNLLELHVGPRYNLILIRGFTKLENMLKALASPAAGDPESLREMLLSLDPGLEDDEVDRDAKRIEFLIDHQTQATFSFRGFTATINSLRESAEPQPSMREVTQLFEPEEKLVSRMSTIKSLANSFKNFTKPSTPSAAVKPPPPPPKI